MSGGCVGANKRVKDVNNHAYIDIIHKIPGYSQSTCKRDKKKIKKIMEEYEYDSDYIENVSNDFCEGFNAAKDIIVKMLSDKHWEQTKGWKNG